MRRTRSSKTPSTRVIKWWRSVTARGYLDTPGVWPTQIPTDTLSDLFRNSEYAPPGQSQRGAQTLIGFLMATLGTMRERPRVDGARVRFYSLPTLEECREHAATVLPESDVIDGHELPKRQIDRMIRERATAAALRDALRRIVAVSNDATMPLGAAIGAITTIAVTTLAETTPGQPKEAQGGA